MTTLLDTHVLIWWLNDQTQLSESKRDVLESPALNALLHVSDVFLWETAIWLFHVFRRRIVRTL